MEYSIIKLVLYLLCTALSFYGLSGIRFEKFCDVSKPVKVQLLLLLCSLALGYLSAEFWLSITLFNGF